MKNGKIINRIMNWDKSYFINSNGKCNIKFRGKISWLVHCMNFKLKFNFMWVNKYEVNLEKNIFNIIFIILILW